MSTYSMGV
ncbi:hypothetical protein FG05_35206 [Fusarium graminearum]|nr:hypothetical protein FG05_35206 [Fusarium graminearum]